MEEQQHQPLRTSQQQLGFQENETNHNILSDDISQTPAVTKKRKRSCQDQANSKFKDEPDQLRRYELLLAYQSEQSRRTRQRNKRDKWTSKGLEVIASKGYEPNNLYGYLCPKDSRIETVLANFLLSNLWIKKQERNVNVVETPQNWTELKLRAEFAEAQCKSLQENLADAPGNELVIADKLPIAQIRDFLVNICGMRVTDDDMSNHESYLRVKYVCIMRLKKQHQEEKKQLRTFPQLVNEMEGNKMISMLDQGRFKSSIEKKIIQHIKKNRFGSNVLVDLVHGQKGGSVNYSCLQEIHELNPDIMPAGNTVALYSRDLTTGFSDWFSYYPVMDYPRKHIQIPIVDFLSAFIYCASELQLLGRTMEQINSGDLPEPICGDLVADGAKIDNNRGAVWAYWRNTMQVILAKRFMPSYVSGVTQLDPYNEAHYPNCQSVENCTLLGSCMSTDNTATNKILLEDTLREIQRLWKPGEYFKWFKQDGSQSTELLFKLNVMFVGDLVGIWKAMWGSAKQSPHFCINCILHPSEIEHDAPFRCQDCRGKGPIPYWLEDEESIPCKHTEFIDSHRIKKAEAETNLDKLNWMFELKSPTLFLGLTKDGKINYMNEIGVPIPRASRGTSVTRPELDNAYRQFHQIHSMNIQDCVLETIPIDVIEQNLKWRGVDQNNEAYMIWLRNEIVISMFDEKFAAVAETANREVPNHNISHFSEQELRIALQFIIYEGRILRTFRNLPDTCLIKMPEIVCCCLLHAEKRWRTTILEITVAEVFRNNTTEAANALIKLVKELFSQALANEDPDDPNADGDGKSFNFETAKERVTIKTTNVNIRKFMKEPYRTKLFLILFDDAQRRNRKQDFSELWDLLEEMISRSLLKKKYTELELRDFQKSCDRFGVKFDSTCGGQRKTCYIHMAVSGELRGQIRRSNYAPLFIHAGHGMEKCNGVNSHIWGGKVNKGGHVGNTPGRSSPIDAFKSIFLHDSLNLFSDCCRHPQEFKSTLAMHGKTLRLERNRTINRSSSTVSVNSPRQSKRAIFMASVSPEQSNKNWSNKRIQNSNSRETRRQNPQLPPNHATTSLESPPALQRIAAHLVTPPTPASMSSAIAWPAAAFPCTTRPQRITLSADESLLSPQQVQQEANLQNALDIVLDLDDADFASSLRRPTAQPVTPATAVEEVSLQAWWTDDEYFLSPHHLANARVLPTDMTNAELAHAFSKLPKSIVMTSSAKRYRMTIDHNLQPKRLQTLLQTDVGAKYDKAQSRLHADLRETNRCFYLHLALANNIHPAQLCATVRGLAVSKLQSYQQDNPNATDFELYCIRTALESAIHKSDLVDYLVLNHAWPRTLLRCAVHVITEQQFSDRRRTKQLRELYSIYPPIDICPNMGGEDLKHVFLHLFDDHYTLMQVVGDKGAVLSDRAALTYLSAGISEKLISQAK